MPETGWGRVIKLARALPERLGTEMSFLSLRGEVETQAILEPCEGLPAHIAYTLTFFSDLPYGKLSRSWIARPNDVLFRFEFALPEALIAGGPLPRSAQLDRFLGGLIAPLGMTEAQEPTYSLPDDANPDPGDLPGVWVIDGNIAPASADHLARASSHHLMRLAADPRVDLLRLPGKTDR